MIIPMKSAPASHANAQSVVDVIPQIFTNVACDVACDAVAVISARDERERDARVDATGVTDVRSIEHLIDE